VFSRRLFQQESTLMPVKDNPDVPGKFSAGWPEQGALAESLLAAIIRRLAQSPYYLKDKVQDCTRDRQDAEEAANKNDGARIPR